MSREVCDECGGTKDGWHRGRNKPVCNNRRCPESPMNDYLVYKGETIGKN